MVCAITPSQQGWREYRWVLVAAGRVGEYTALAEEPPLQDANRTSPERKWYLFISSPPNDCTRTLHNA